jgi:hypothetical protein
MVLKLSAGFFKGTTGTAITVLGRVLVIEGCSLTILNPLKAAIMLFTSVLTFPLLSETAAPSGFDGSVDADDEAMVEG